MKTDSTHKLSKRAKWLIALGIAFLLYTVVGFFVVPAVIKSQMLQRLPALTKRQAAVEQVKFNPYALSLTIDGFSLKETNGEVFSSFSELYVNFQMSSIFKRSWVFDEIHLWDPFAQVTYRKDGTFNFANLLENPSNAPAPPAAPQKPQAPPPVIVYHLSISNGAVAFADLTRKSDFKIRYQPININLTNFTTVHDKSSPYEIAVASDSGESFGWSGNVTINPLRSSGKFRLGGLNLKKYMPYSQDYARFVIVDGRIDAVAEYSYDSATNALDLVVTNTSVALSRFQLMTPDTKEKVIAIPTLSIKGIQAHVARRTAGIGSINSSGGTILVRREHDGSINLLSGLILPKETATTSTTNAAVTSPAPPWTAKIDEINFDKYWIKAEDKKSVKLATFNINQLRFNVKNISNVSNAPVNVDLGLQLGDAGEISVNGTATLLPVSADLQIDLHNLDLRMAQPYIDEQVKVALRSGLLDVKGRARFAPSQPGVPLVTFDGDVSVKDFAAADGVMFNDLAKWDSLDISGIDVALQPDKFGVGQIKFSGLNTSIGIQPDHRLNIVAILPEKKAGPGETNSSPATNTIPNVTLGALVFENASLHFADRSLEPNCTFDVQEFGGSISNISSQVQTPAVVDMKGKIDAISPFSISGKINPMPDKLFTDIAVTFTNTGLTAFSPYMGAFAGRPLNKGKLSLALHYRIDGKALNAANGIFIDQLTLGAKNNNTNATKLPVKLAIALLKDRKGRIGLDIPVQGKLDDPKFRVWPIIRGVVENLIIKAATSPFSLLGSMFGNGKELGINFDPAQSNILPADGKILDAFSQSLYDHPELTVEINGLVDPAKDRPEMVRAKFERQIKALYNKEWADAGKPTIALEELKLEPADYQRLVVEAYTNVFGPVETTTNQTANAPAEVLAPALTNPRPVQVEQTPLRPPSLFSLRGAARLTYSAQASVPSPVVVSTNQPPPVVAATPQIDLPAMEQRLKEKIEITSDDFRQLMEDRAKAVEDYLVKSGKVAAERLFITAPKPVSANSTGEDRVNLTLD